MGTREKNGTLPSHIEVLECPQCGRSTVETRPQIDRFKYKYGGDEIQVEVLLPVRVCRSCQFQYLDDDAEKIRHEAVCRHLGVLTPEQIRSIRDSYKLSRAEFARLTRLGEATLPRWENGLLIQNQAYDRYLRLLQYSENMRRLEASNNDLQSTDNRDSDLSPPSEYRFRALVDVNAVRTGQAKFRLHRSKSVAA